MEERWGKGKADLRQETTNSSRGRMFRLITLKRQLFYLDCQSHKDRSRSLYFSYLIAIVFSLAIKNTYIIKNESHVSAFMFHFCPPSFDKQIFATRKPKFHNLQPLILRHLCYSDTTVTNTRSISSVYTNSNTNFVHQKLKSGFQERRRISMFRPRPLANQNQNQVGLFIESKSTDRITAIKNLLICENIDKNQKGRPGRGRKVKLYASSSSSNENSNSKALKFDYRIDYYSILKVTSKASKEEIKRSYRRLALQTHPDISGKSPAEKEKNSADFIKINQAYEILIDEITRVKYDKARQLFLAYGSASSSSSPSSSNRGGYTSNSRSTSSSSASKTYADYSRDYAERKREYDDMYDTNGDNFGKIFSDFWKTINEEDDLGEGDEMNYNGKGPLEDFVDFLERKTYQRSTASASTRRHNERENNEIKDRSRDRQKRASSSTSSSPSSSYSSFFDDIYTDDDDLLYNGTLDELLLEIENTKYLLQRLREKETLFKAELVQSEIRTKEMKENERKNKQRNDKNYTERASYIEERMNAVEKVAGLKAKIQNVATYITTSKKRLQRLEKREREKGVETTRTNRSGNGSRSFDSSGKESSAGSSASSTYRYTREDRDDRKPSSSSSSSGSTTRDSREPSSSPTSSTIKDSSAKRSIKNMNNKEALQKLKVDEELEILKKKMGLK